MPAIRVRPSEYNQTEVIVTMGDDSYALPWQAALEVGKALIRASRKGEEWAKREKIADDQAIVHKLQLPFGLTSNPVIQKEAVKRAEDVKTNRIHIPATSVVSCPKLVASAKTE